MSQGIINQGPHPDISSLEALRCLECIWRSRQTALGCFYPQTRPRAASWLMAKWRIKHLCVEDQKGTGRKKCKCTCLLEEHHPYQHLVALNNVHLSHYYIPVRKTHLHITSIPGWQILWGCWVVSPMRQFKKLPFFPSSFKIRSSAIFSSVFPHLFSIGGRTSSPKNSWESATWLQIILCGLGEGGGGPLWMYVMIKSGHTYSRWGWKWERQNSSQQRKELCNNAGKQIKCTWYFSN